ncbi:P63C domain-containing protein [Sorangium sp. So ce295]|uniref:P63C domain-containing protein n=1 Tax=Sorangium sp. So ce295 TaxID=3133295 RepID=UPI003F61AC4B
MAASKGTSKRAKKRSSVKASKGGLARRDALSPEERKSIAQRAAAERWAAIKGLPRETHTGILDLGAGIPCSVLSNGKRVFSVNGLLRAFGSGGKSRTALPDGTPVPEFLAANNLQPFISTELSDRLANTIKFMPMSGGSPAYGYLADILNLVCEALLDARRAGVLRPNQLRVADGAEIVMRAFAKVGVIALIDEATGYQADRASDELQRLVEAYVVEDMRPWVRLFPDSFFRQVYRIHGWQYKPGVTQGPRYVGKFINKYVYERLPPPVLARLRELNPVVDKRRKHKHHQFLSEALGEPTVDRHLASVTTLMTVSSTKTHFEEMFRVAFPKAGEQLLMREVLQPPLQIEPSLDEAASEPMALPKAPEEEPVLGGIKMLSASASVREQVLRMLRYEESATFSDLTLAVYGHDSTGQSRSREARNAAQNMRKLLGRMSAEGLVEVDADKRWRLGECQRV